MFDVIVTIMRIAITGELILVAVSRKLLETLIRNRIGVAADICVLRQNHRSSSHERVDQRLLLLRCHFCSKILLDPIDFVAESVKNRRILCLFGEYL